MADAEALARKTQLFRTLDSFEDEDEEVEETVYQKKLNLMDFEAPRTVPAQALTRSRKTLGASRKRRHHVISSPPHQADKRRPLIRRATEPASSSSRRPEIITISDSPVGRVPTALRPPTLVQSKSSPAVPTISAAKLIGDTPRPTTAAANKKKKYQIQQVPEAQRIFKDCIFYFFRASDIDKPRRLMITKSIEYGGIWIREWDSRATHIIMDRGLSKDDLFKHTPLTETPPSTVAVDQTFISDCLQNRALLNPSYYQSLVIGFESIPGVQSPAVPSPARSDKSLPIKPARGKGMIGNELIQGKTPSIQEDTPSRSEAASDDIRSPPSPIARRSPQVRHDSPPRISPPSPSENASHGPASALDEAIAEARDTAELLIDSDDEDTSRPTSSNSIGSGDENKEKSVRKSGSNAGGTLDAAKVPAWQQKFTCMQPNRKFKGEAASGPNASIIDLLQQMADYYDNTKDEWRTIAYRKAISALKKHPTEINTADEAIKLPGIGTRLAAKIEEIRWTSRLRRLENALLEPSDQSLKLFLGIYGVGPALAGTWAQRGYRSIADLSTHGIQLTSNQQIGIEHYDDFATRIPRVEVALHGEIVSKALHNIDPAFTITVGGSYRRGASTSGDVDMLVSHPTNSIGYIRQIVLDTLVPRLTTSGCLVAALATTSRDDGTRWHGACQLPASHLPRLPETSHIATMSAHRPWRRIDLLLVPHDEMGAALLYFTGNDIFNRSMRLLARKKGMRLNQRGLYKDVMRDWNRAGKKLNEGVKVAGEVERDIFEVLGVPWRECTERDC